MYEWEHNLKRMTERFLQMLVDPDYTLDPT